MAREEIRVDIVADDQASAEIEDVGKKAEKLEADPVLVKVDADASKAEDGFKKVKRAADDVGTSADQSGSVVANFAGNAAQDMGELAGVTGTAGVAMGQFAEYATEGGISMGKLVGSALPLAGVALVLSEIMETMAEGKENKAFNKEQIIQWSKAIRDGKDELEILKEQIEETGQLLLSSEFTRGEFDFLPDLNAIGLDLDGFNQLLELSREELQDWADAQRAAGTDTDLVARVMTAQITTLENMGAAQRSATVSTEFLGTAAQDAADSFDRLKNSLDMEASFLGAVGDADNLASSLADVAYMAALGMQGTEEFADAERAAAEDTNALKQTVMDLVEEYGTIPEEERTRILAELPANEQYLFSLWLAEVEQGAVAPIGIDTTAFDAGLRRIRSSFGFLGAGGGVLAPAPGATTNVTINAPRGTRPSELITAGQQYARRNGRHR